MRLSRFYPTLGALFVLPLTLQAQGPEDFRVEATLAVWLRDTSGTIQSGVVPVDLQADLGIEQRRPQFAGRLVVKPGRRHRLVIEGIPYRLAGDNTVVRQFTFAGRTYTVRDRITSDAQIDFISGAYQFDVVSRPGGHLGFLGGVAYVDATGTVRSEAGGFSGTEAQSFPFPVVGTEFRVFPIGGRPLLNINGEVKGMSLGNYGHFVHGGIHAGLGLGRHVSLQAGYLAAAADVHRKDETRGFSPHFSGPVFALQFRR